MKLSPVLGDRSQRKKKTLELYSCVSVKKNTSQSAVQRKKKSSHITVQSTLLYGPIDATEAAPSKGLGAGLHTE